MLAAAMSSVCGLCARELGASLLGIREAGSAGSAARDPDTDPDCFVSPLLTSGDLEWLTRGPIHWDCAIRWPDWEEFRREVLDAVRAEIFDSVYEGFALSNDQALVAALPAEDKVFVWPAATAVQITAPLHGWREWLARPSGLLHLRERAALAQLLPLLRRELPTQEAVLATDDWASKDRCREEEEQLDAESWREWQVDIAELARKSREVERHIEGEGLTCPRCGAFARSYRLIRRTVMRPPFFICQQSHCGCSFSADEIA